MIITDLNYMEAAVEEVQGAAGADTYLHAVVKGEIGEVTGKTYASAGRSGFFFFGNSGAKGGTSFGAGVVNGKISINTGSSAGA
jgi:hypothetical protein